MRIFDTDGNEIENPDLDKGRLFYEQKPVVHTWVIDVVEQTHEEVIAEYPNGGKDVEIVVDVEEQGHWETRDEDGSVIDFDGFIPDDMQHEVSVKGMWAFQRYRVYTDEELAEIARKKAEGEAAAAQAAKREEFLVSAPERMEATEQTQAEVDDALCALYEQSIAQQTVIDEQDDAICELYELIRN